MLPTQKIDLPVVQYAANESQLGSAEEDKKL